MTAEARLAALINDLQALSQDLRAESKERLWSDGEELAAASGRANKAGDIADTLDQHIAEASA